METETKNRNEQEARDQHEYDAQLCSECNPRFAQIVRRNFDVHAVANADANKILAHFAGNMREHFVTIGKRHTEHCSGKHLGHRAFQFNRFFFRHRPGRLCPRADRVAERGWCAAVSARAMLSRSASMQGCFRPASKTTVDIVCEKARVLREL